MPSINAALGLAQLDLLSKIISKKKKLLKSYIKVFRHNKFGKIYKSLIYKNNYWLVYLF